MMPCHGCATEVMSILALTLQLVTCAWTDACSCLTCSTLVSREEGHHQTCIRSHNCNTWICDCLIYIGIQGIQSPDHELCMHAYMQQTRTKCSIVLLPTKYIGKTNVVVDQLCLGNFHTLRDSLPGCFKCSAVPLSKLYQHSFLESLDLEDNIIIRVKALSHGKTN